MDDAPMPGGCCAASQASQHCAGLLALSLHRYFWPVFSAKYGHWCQSLLQRFYWNKNTLDVLKIHNLVAFIIIFYLICVGENLAMTVLAAGNSWLPLVGNGHTFIQAAHDRMHWCQVVGVRQEPLTSCFRLLWLSYKEIWFFRAPESWRGSRILRTGSHFVDEQ